MYEIISKVLATDGIGDNYLVQPPNEAVHEEPILYKDRGRWFQLDARILSDEGDSDDYVYEYLIDYGVRMIKKGLPLVVVCGAGQSRSNAIALGILVQNFHMDFYDAYELIREKVPIQWIHPDHISKLKKLFNVTLP